MAKIIGIDLGTTNSCVAVMEGSEPVVIPNSEGHRTTPSVVAFTAEGERKVGDPAKRQAITNPKRTVFSIKRFMGEAYDKVASRHRARSLYDRQGREQHSARGHRRTPVHAAGDFGHHSAKDEEDGRGLFGSGGFGGRHHGSGLLLRLAASGYEGGGRDRGSRRCAVSSTSLRPPRWPTVWTRKSSDLKIAVYDLGGGTFDISILELGDGVFEVKSHQRRYAPGRRRLRPRASSTGMAEAFKAEHQIDLRQDPMALQRLKEAAEKAKIELFGLDARRRSTCRTSCPSDGIPQHLVMTLTRAKFEQLCYRPDRKHHRALRTGSARRGAECFADRRGDPRGRFDPYSRDPEDASRSSSARPEPFKGEPRRGAWPIGAAIQGGVLTGEVKDVLLLDVTPLSLGIETLGGVIDEAHRRQHDDPDPQVARPSRRLPTTSLRWRSTSARANVRWPATTSRSASFHLDGIPAGAARRSADRGNVRHRRQRHSQRLGQGQGHGQGAEDPHRGFVGPYRAGDPADARRG